MKTTRSVEITMEREEVLLIRKPANRTTLWCTRCGGDVHMLTTEEAMTVTGASWQAIARRVRLHDVHFTETLAGGLLICINSL